MAKILIVDDDPQMSKLYADILRLEHYEVETIDDSQTGLAKAKENPPSLILLDVMMPKMNGIEVLSELKKDDKTKKVPTVILSNVADDQYIQQSMDKGAQKYLIKTDYEPDQFLAVIHELLGDKK